MRNEEQVWRLVDARRDAYVALADRLFDTPEIAYREFRAVAAHARALEAEGFRLRRGVAGIPTAVVGEAGPTDGNAPVIALLGEYDALPGLSQEPGLAERRPVHPAGAGHGCGHNLLGAASLLAAAAVRQWLEESGSRAVVRYYGCPAEEGGAAKTFMVRDGLFDDVDAAISWHPSTFTAVNPANSLANARIDYSFTGRAAHAASAPELGRSALDAGELMNVGVNYLREHMPARSRIHYAWRGLEGLAENVVPDRATVRQLIRSPSLPGLSELVARVDRIAEGATLMTDTRVARQLFTATSNLLDNPPLEAAMQACLDRLGPPRFDSDDVDYARRIRETLSPEDILASFHRIGMASDPELPVCDFVAPLGGIGESGVGSTDVGDVSWVAPTVQARVATCAVGTPFHSWQLTAQGKSGLAHKGMVHAAKVMAATAVAVLEDREILAAARQALDARLARSPYRCPIPDEVAPPVVEEGDAGSS